MSLLPDLTLSEIRGNFIFEDYTVKAKQVAFENYGLTVVEGGSQWGDGFYDLRLKFWLFYD